MQDFAILTRWAQERNWSISESKAYYWKIEGDTVVSLDTTKRLVFRIHYKTKNAFELSALRKSANAMRKRLKAMKPSFAFNTEGASFQFNNVPSTESLDEAYGLLRAFIEMNRIANLAVCNHCKKPTSVIVRDGVEAYGLCEPCLRERVVPGSAGFGIVGAVLGGLVGMIPWVIVSLLGYFSAYLGAIVAMAAFKGYQLFGGKRNRGTPFLIGLVSLCSVLVGEIGSTAFILIAYLGEFRMQDLLSFYAEPESIFNLVLAVAFANFGVFLVAKNTKIAKLEVLAMQKSETPAAETAHAELLPSEA